MLLSVSAKQKGEGFQWDPKAAYFIRAFQISFDLLHLLEWYVGAAQRRTHDHHFGTKTVLKQLKL